MRFSRILLASLAPLIGMSAMMTPAPQEGPREELIIRLWHTVAQWAAAAPEEDSTGIALPDHGSLHAVLHTSALIFTPFRHSLWMLTPVVALLAFMRRPQRLLLRC